MSNTQIERPYPKQVCPSPLSLCEDLQVIEDPRRKQAVCHPLIGIMVMALCAIAAGADGWMISLTLQSFTLNGSKRLFHVESNRHLLILFGGLYSL